MTPRVPYGNSHTLTANHPKIDGSKHEQIPSEQGK
jgi:hypothetical protein